MTTVVLKLFNCIQPACAVFGKKDYQQLMIVRGMVRQFALPIEIVAGETLREPDGLAMSSRNGYLSASERAEAPRLQRVLQHVKSPARRRREGLRCSGWRGVAPIGRCRLEAGLRRGAQASGSGRARPRQTLELVVLGAARLGGTRLIDNVEV